MGFSSDIQGDMQADRPLTEAQVMIIAEACVASDNRHTFMAYELKSQGRLICSSDNSRDAGLTPLNRGWKEYRENRFQSGNWGVDFAGLLESLIALKGLEGLIWNGTFTIVSESSGEFPKISRVIVKDNVVTRKVAEILFPEDGQDRVILAPDAS